MGRPDRRLFERASDEAVESEMPVGHFVFRRGRELFGLVGMQVRRTGRVTRTAGGEAEEIERGFEALDLRSIFAIPIEDADVEADHYVLASGRSQRWAILINEAVGLVEVPRSATHALPVRYRGPERGWFIGIIEHEGRLVPVIDPDGLSPEPHSVGAADPAGG